MAYSPCPGSDGLIRRYRIGLRSMSHCHGYEAMPVGPCGLVSPEAYVMMCEISANGPPVMSLAWESAYGVAICPMIARSPTNTPHVVNTVAASRLRASRGRQSWG